MDLHQKSIDAYEAGDKETSLRFIDSVVILNPRALAAWTQKSGLEAELGRDTAAFRSSNRAIEIFETNPRSLPRGSGNWIGPLYQRRGLLKLKFGDTTGAAADLETGHRYLSR